MKLSVIKDGYVGRFDVATFGFDWCLRGLPVWPNSCTRVVAATTILLKIACLSGNRSVLDVANNDMQEQTGSKHTAYPMLLPFVESDG